MIHHTNYLNFNYTTDKTSFYDLLKKNSKVIETGEDESTTEDKKTDVTKPLGGNGEAETEKPITISALEDAIDECDTISFSNEEDGTFAEQLAYKAELANELEVAKLDDKKKANRFYDMFNDRIKYDKDDLKIGLEYSIKQIEDEAVQKDLLKQLEIIKKAEKDDKIDELEPTLDLVS